MQENMEFGFVGALGSTSFLDGTFANMEFDFQPGFKVGMGMNFDYDSWDSSLMYTWLHGTSSQHASVDVLLQEIFPMLGHPEATDLTTYSSANERWNLKLDFADLDLGRTYYVGTKFLFRPAFGARAAWIRQRLHVTYTNASAALGTIGTAEVSQSSTSWGLGPRAGLNAQYLIGAGFRFYGNGAADILYTRYTSLKENSRFILSTGALQDSVHIREKELGYLRPHLELELGLGWGTYLDCNNWYMDFSAGYGFQAFFNQNMFRHYGAATTGISAANSWLPNGDLYVQGLTATFSLDF